jgi:hypothetical protein
LVLGYSGQAKALVQVMLPLCRTFRESILMPICGGIVLTEEEKSRIRAEEIFRDEVRRELETKQPPSRAQKIWTFLNSSLALWFLSSVVLAGLTTAVTSYQARHTEHLRKAESERRLDTEISSRIGLALRVVRVQQAQVARGGAPPDGYPYGTAIAYLDNSFANTPWDFSIYPEYKARPFRSLISERASIANPSERFDLKEAMAIYDKLMDGGSRANGQKENAAQAEPVIELLESLTKHRWISPEGMPEGSN